MRHHTKLIFGFLILALMLGGCASNNPKPKPKPGDTETRPASQGKNPYYVPTAPSGGVYQDDYSQIGLESRGSNLPSSSESTQSSGGPNPNAIANIYFDFNKSGVSPDQRIKLQDVAAYMNDNTQVSSLIEGHCDWRGTVEYNLALGERRAKSIANYLINLGIATNRLDILSKGDLEAVVEGSKQEMAQDRRVDIIPVQ